MYWKGQPAGEAGTAPWCVLHGAIDQSQTTVGMRLSQTSSIASGPHKDASRRVERKDDQGYAGGAEPEELCVGKSPFHCVDVSCVERPELCVAGRIDTSTDHESPLRSNLGGYEKQSCDGHHKAHESCRRGAARGDSGRELLQFLRRENQNGRAAHLDQLLFFEASQ